MLSHIIFKAYDIRGIFNDTLTLDGAALIGQAIGSLALEQGLQTIVVGRDGRLSSEQLQNALVGGITCSGVDVLDVGMVPTPVVYFAARFLNINSCVMVTGSHNPPQYNGFKMMLSGHTLYGTEIGNLYQRIKEGRLHYAIQHGQINRHDILHTYLDAVSTDIQLARPMNIAIDCGNGVGGIVATELFKRLGCSVTELFCEIDGHFPNHHPDPAEPQNLFDLQNTMRTIQAEVGLAFDGDADRLGVVAPDGQIIYSDRQIMLFAQDILSRSPNATIIYDVKCSAYLPRFIKQHHGRALMWKTGHSLMKAKLKETQAVFAGEMSGHLYFNDRWAGLDDGLYAGARLLEILSHMKDRHHISAAFNALPQGISTPEITIPLKEGEAHQIMCALLQTEGFKDAVLSTVDGLRADYTDGFGLVRASNTTPSLVLRFEADCIEALLRIQDEFKSELFNIKTDIQLPF